MKDYFDLKVFITVLIALIVFAILNKMFLEKQIEKIALKKGESKENYENAEETELEDEEDV